ncbi:MAG: RsmG family class I SAM-dependent methyltransferase [Acidimicrobiales bacterium]
MVSRALLQALADARRQKFLGPGPLEAHIMNARGFASLIATDANTIVDIGSGGGVPALVLAELLPHARFVLIERGARRANFLTNTVRSLDLSERVSVLASTAEDAAHEVALAGTADTVTARGFAAPAVTAECACRLLRQGGSLIVSEPPHRTQGASRWPAAGLARTGLAPTQRARRAGNSYQVLTRSGDIDPALPRRSAAIRSRPLF